ncbi:MAG: hypothetical protein RIE53_01615 [Rhodothermales bacterium]
MGSAIRTLAGLRAGVMAALVCGLLLAGCANEVDPLSDQSGSLFAVHGFLTMLEDTQQLRVERLRPTILSDASSASSARVRTIHEPTGEVVEWRVADGQPDGLTGTLFEAEFRPVLGTYRLEVSDPSRPDAPVLTARTTVPDVPPVIVGSADIQPTGVSLPLTLPGVQVQPEQMSMVYRVRPPGSQEVQDVEINYGKTGTAVQAGWRFTVFLNSDRQWVLNLLGVDTPAGKLSLSGISVQSTILSAEWSGSAEGNIQDGHGFFGSVSRVTLMWLPAPALADLAGFVVEP